MIFQFLDLATEIAKVLFVLSFGPALRVQPVVFFPKLGHLLFQRAVLRVERVGGYRADRAIWRRLSTHVTQASN